MNKKKNTENISDLDPMTMAKAQNLMVEFSDTIFWQALLFILNRQDAQAVATLATIDTFKEPTQAARAQGQRISINFIRELVKSAAEKGRKQAENEKNADEDGDPAGYAQY